MAGAGSGTVSRWAGPAMLLRENGKAGVERFQWGQNHTQHMTAGFFEVNGDGIIDHVVEERRIIDGVEHLQRLAIRSSGLPQEIDQELLGNQTAWRFQERGRAILLPGPVNVIQSTQTNACPVDPNTGALLVTDQTPYVTRMLSTLRDLTGDGIADYVFFGTPTALSNGVDLDYPGVELNEGIFDSPSWWIMIGTNASFIPPRPIQAPLDAPFEIYTTEERCDGLISRVFRDLIDMDGDGRLDLVRTDDQHRIVVAKLIGGTGGIGAHDAGRLVRGDNGYGAATLISYGSAKADFRTEHQIPFEEIVVTETRTVLEKDFGTDLEPIRYAYGDATLHYQPLLGRWVFSGYGTRVVLQGLPVPQTESRLHGTATIVETLRAEDFSNSYERHVLTGSVRDVNDLIGAFTVNPWELLDISYASDPRWRGNRHVEYGTKFPSGQGTSGSGSVAPNEECYDINPLIPLPALSDPKLCRRSGIIYEAEITNW